MHHNIFDFKIHAKKACKKYTVKGRFLKKYAKKQGYTF